jgi:hypothetical protein
MSPAREQKATTSCRSAFASGVEAAAGVAKAGISVSSQSVVSWASSRSAHWEPGLTWVVSGRPLRVA